MPEPQQYPHVYGPTRLNHGNAQCRYCLATDLEILYALDPNHCPQHEKVATTAAAEAGGE